MRASKKDYEEVAKRCSSFEKKEKSSFTNKNTSDTECVSCINCSHFASDEHCVLDLYDDIAKNI